MERKHQLNSRHLQLSKKCRDYRLRDQLQRSAVSIPSNIAEGYERDTNKEFIRFLYIAKGSSAELRTQLHIAIEVNIVDQTIGIQLINRTRKISSMLYNLIRTRSEKFE
jgi:four helix bundle protein